MEQRITRAKRRVAAARGPFETPGAVARAERLGAVAAMVYLLFNEGYSASGGDAHIRMPLCEEAIRLARLLLRLFPAEPEIMGLVALLLLQHARAAARLDAKANIVLLEDQDRGLWNREMIAEGSCWSRRRCATAVPVRIRRRPRSPRSMPGRCGPKTQIGRRSTGCTLCWKKCSPRRSSPSTARSPWPRSRGPEAALAMIEPLAERLSGYFHFFGLKGALLKELGRAEEARVAFDRAIALANTAAEAAHIRMHLDRLAAGGRRERQNAHS